LGPLGPLGDNFSIPQLQPEQPPAPPQKEQINTSRNVGSVPQPSINRSMLDSVDLEDDAETSATTRARPSPGFPSQVQTQPNIAEQAVMPSFSITVGDPHKVGDLTSSHIVYQVRTKVSLNRILWTMDLSL